MEILLLIENQAVEPAEIDGGVLPLDAAQRVEVGLVEDALQRLRQQL